MTDNLQIKLWNFILDIMFCVRLHVSMKDGVDVFFGKSNWNNIIGKSRAFRSEPLKNPPSANYNNLSIRHGSLRGRRDYDGNNHRHLHQRSEVPGGIG